MPTNQKAVDIRLVPASEFKNAVNQILGVSKKQSDEQLAKMQASNARKRKAARQSS